MPRDITKLNRVIRAAKDIREKTPCKKTLIDSNSKFKIKTIKNQT
jgi:hypothetical protein